MPAGLAFCNTYACQGILLRQETACKVIPTAYPGLAQNDLFNLNFDYFLHPETAHNGNTNYYAYPGLAQKKIKFSCGLISGISCGLGFGKVVITMV